MKRFLVLFSLTLLFAGVQARVVNVEKAALAAGADARLTYTASANGKPAFYVFNKESDSGFVIVAADDVVGDNIVLGYSDNGPFDYESSPDNFKWLLSEYQAQIESLRSSGRRVESKKTPDRAEVTIAPLLGDNKWGQSFPYNWKCPQLNGHNCVTGCVATSMSQIMYYYKWPLVGTGSNEYTWIGSKLSADFSEAPFRWYEMLPYYVSNGLTEDMVLAVSDLLYKCGISVNMSYGLGESSASDAWIPGALKNYFGYSSARMINRSDYSEEDWISLLKGNLQKKMPVIYSGESDGGGHAFVCDGYNSSDYFHFNFGWKGLNDGYYLVSVAGDYNKRQQMVCDIIPGKTPVISGGVYLSRLGNGQAEVTSFGLTGGYTGEVMIPESVTIGDEVLTITSINSDAFMNSGITKVTVPSSVKRIAAGAFFGCNNLKTIVVEGAVPEVYDGKLFDNSVYSEAKLIVPEGSVELYSSVMPWMCFCNITDGVESKQWSEWTKAGDGTGTGTYVNLSGTDTFNGTAENLPVSYRYMLTDTYSWQFKIDDWMNASTLIINADMESGECVVKSQTTGNIITTTDGVSDYEFFVYFTDIPSFYTNLSYSSYPCVFDRETGTFTLNSLFVPYGMNAYFSMGVYSFKIDGFDYSKIDPVSVKTEFVDSPDIKTIFNLNGQSVNEPLKGSIYIINGEKVLY